MSNIIIENDTLHLELNEKCIPVSLICKETGDECLEKGVEIPFFSLTEARPYNNEIKLAHPNKRTTFAANRVRREGERLIVGFELVTFEAAVEVKIAPMYVSFTLSEFIIKDSDFEELCMTPPPVEEFRLIGLPVRNRERFGEWLNVSFDEKAAVCVLGNSPLTRIDSEKRDGYRIMYADALREVKLKGASSSLIVTPKAKLMDAVESLEEDYDLPRGVASRRNGLINASIYWSKDITPENVDRHIAYAKAGGFKLMLLFYKGIFNEPGWYHHCGDYDYSEHFPKGAESLSEMLAGIKAAGIIPGFHFLHTHIGIESRYVTPVADHRLNLTRHFTLARPLGTADTEIFVEEDPEGSVMHEKCRVLKFGGELIHYEGYNDERPYRFYGCTRGYLGTNVRAHELGTIGGILDISEFGAKSVYIDQHTSLQDEIADKLAECYNAGFEFIYMDGSEGTNPPFEVHVPGAQYRVYKKLGKAPIFCEGAAKSNFSWHMLSGGNAFDTFKTHVFKEKIAEHPLEEADRMADDFTRVNFGWWGCWNDTMPDIVEYGTSKAASKDCPATIISDAEVFETNPRAKDNFEIMRRWEEVREKKLLTPEQKHMLADPDREFTLIKDENGGLKLVEYIPMPLPEDSDPDITAYTFTYGGRKYVTAWHKTDSGKITFESSEAITYGRELFGERFTAESAEGKCVVEVADRMYIDLGSKK